MALKDAAGARKSGVSLDAVTAYELPELIERLKRTLSLEETAAQHLFADTKHFLYLSALSPESLRPPPRIDACLHEFMLYSREYSHFCESRLGRFIHHTPDPYLPGQRPVGVRATEAARELFGTLCANWEYAAATSQTLQGGKPPTTRPPQTLGATPLREKIGSPRLFAWKTGLEKVALYSRDRLDLAEVTRVNPADIRVTPEPFPHIVIDDFFRPEQYRALSEAFDAVRSRGFLDAPWSEEYFHRFDMDYDGYVYTPRATLDPESSLPTLFSLEWNWFFSKVFRRFVGFETSVAFHHHPAGNRTGFMHHDNVDKYFSRARRLRNGVMYGEGPESDPLVRRRKIALIYFLNNDGWREGDGGEVGLYGKDGSLTKTVAPLSNRMLAFEISDRSLHAFQENHRERNSIVQWFHTLPQLA